jgi:hypothetical protein
MLADIVAKVGGWQLGRNNRIATGNSLNQHCSSGPDLESMLLPRSPKIFLQQYRPTAAMCCTAAGVSSLGSCGGYRCFRMLKESHILLDTPGYCSRFKYDRQTIKVFAAASAG